jgi:predicted component of type VI protein secretion system
LTQKSRDAEKTKIAKLLRKVIEQFEKRLQNEDIKPTIGDYLKLVQIEKEMQKDEAKEIKVTWVEPGEESEN